MVPMMGKKKDNAPGQRSNKVVPRTKKIKPLSAKGKANRKPLRKISSQGVSTLVQKKNFRPSSKKKIEDFSESDIDSDDDLGMNGPEFGLLSDSSSSSDGFDDNTEVHDTMVKKAGNDIVENGNDSQGSDVGQDDQSMEDADEEGEFAGDESGRCEDQMENVSAGGGTDEESADSDDEDASDDDCGTDDSSSEEIPQPEGSIQGDSSDDEEQKPKTKQSAHNMEDDSRTIFVGNLPHEVKKHKLKKWFAKFGAVESVRLRSPPVADPSVLKKVSVIQKDFHASRSNINAYVRFVKAATVEKALKANGHLWNGTHHIRVDRVAAKAEYDPKKAIFIGNLPFDAEEEQIRDIFVDCGSIVSVRIVRDRRTNVGKGFAYVNFAERHSVQLALAKNASQLGKRQIRVKRFDYSGPTNPKTTSKMFKSKQQSFTKNMQLTIRKKKEDANSPNFQGAEAKKKLKNKKKSMKRKLKKKQAFVEVLNSKPKKPKTF